MAVSSAHVVDARKWQAAERRYAVVQLRDAVVMFTAAWKRPSTLVERPDGSLRRRYVVYLSVPSEHREQSFLQVSSIELHFPEGTRPLCSDDIEGVIARDLESVTIAMYIGD